MTCILYADTLLPVYGGASAPGYQKLPFTHEPFIVTSSLGLLITFIAFGAIAFAVMITFISIGLFGMRLARYLAVHLTPPEERQVVDVVRDPIREAMDNCVLRRRVRRAE